MLPVPTITSPTPIEQFGNPALRASIQQALAGIDPGHGNALLSIDNKGAGMMFVQRLNHTWSAIAAARYDFQTKKPEIQVEVAASW